MTKYNRCIICNKEKKESNSPYCSARCKRDAYKRTEIVFEHKDHIFNDIAKMCPIMYQDALQNIAEKYYISKLKIGRLFKESMRYTFKAYPRFSCPKPILYLPGQEDEARNIYLNNIKQLKPNVFMAIKKNVKKKRDNTPIVLEMWAKGEPIHKIQKECKLSINSIKRIISENGGEFIG